MNPPFFRRAAARLCGVAIVACAALSPVCADLITFDDLSNFDPIPNGYHGFDWDNLYTLDTAQYTSTPSGYQTGLVSPTFVAYNGFGDPASFMVSTSGTFTLSSAYLTGAWNDGLQVVATGYNNGVPRFVKTVTVDAIGPTFVTFDWLGIDSVGFASSGGVNHGYIGSGTQFVLDNLTVNGSVSAVPEPGAVTFGVLAAGSVMGLIARKRKA